MHQVGLLKKAHVIIFRRQRIKTVNVNTENFVQLNELIFVMTL